MKLLASLIRLYQNFKNWVSTITKKWHRKNVPLYTVLYVEDFPNECTPHILYLMGKPGKEWLAGFCCPCGCGDFIELVLDGHHPTWRLLVSKDGRPSLYPSVFRTEKCRSHFFLDRGTIRWCR